MPGDSLEPGFPKIWRIFAQVYVDQYFEPSEKLQLNEKGKSKAEALGHFTLGRIQDLKGNTAAAVESYLKVLELQPDQLDLSRKCAVLLARSGKQPKARELLESALKRNPDIAKSYIMLSEFLATYHSNNQDNKERSLTLAREAVEKFPKEPITYEHLAEMYLAGNRKEEAKTLLTRVLESENSNPDFWLRLGKLARRIWKVRPGIDGQEKEFEMLNRFFAKAMGNARSNDSVREEVADFYLATRQYDRAEKIFVSLIKRKTDRLDLRKKLARVYLAKKDTDAYLKTLLAIVEINPRDVATLRQIADTYQKEGDIPNAVKHRKAALKVGKGSAKEYEELAELMVNAGMHEESIEFINEAAYLFPENPSFHWLMTFAYRKLEKYGEAAKYFGSCEKLAKKHRPRMLSDQFYFQFGATTERAGDIENAAKLFQKTIELIGKKDPDQEQKEFTATVYNYLGYMWLENDMNIDPAGELIKTAVDLDPKSGAIADSLGWYYFKKGRFEDALKELRRSESLIEEPDAVIFDHIAQTYYALGKSKEAIEYMEKAVKLEPEKEEFTKRLQHYKEAANSPTPKPAPAPAETPEKPKA